MNLGRRRSVDTRIGLDLGRRRGLDGAGLAGRTVLGAPQQVLDRGEAGLERLESPHQLLAGVTATPGDLASGLLAAPGDLAGDLLTLASHLARHLLTTTRDAPRRLLALAGELARLLAAALELGATAAHELVDQVAGAIARMGRRSGGRRERVADRAAKRLGPAGLGVVRLLTGLAIGLFGVGFHALAGRLLPAQRSLLRLALARTLPRYLEPTAPIAAEAVLTGDPKRAMELATAVTERPLMSNLARGLWGYHGRTESGAELSVHSTGIGGPSTALVLRELHGHGIRRAIRVGTAATSLGSIELGAAVIGFEAACLDGTSRALLGLLGIPVDETDPSWIGSSHALAGGLIDAAGMLEARVASTDLPLAPGAAGIHGPAPAGAHVADLSTAAFLAQARVLGVEAATVLVITSVPGAELSLEDADGACLAAGRVAAELLTGA